MKKIYISPVCEFFLTEQEEILEGSVVLSSGAGDYEPDIPLPGTDNGGGDIGGSEDFAKGGLVWDNGSIFD